MIWHVIKKDLRSLWWLGPLLAASAIGYGYSLVYHMEIHGGGLGAGQVLSIGPYLAVGLALARAVQLDSPAFMRGDWHTRPMGRWSILAAKVLLAAGGVLLPWFLIDLAWQQSWGIGLTDALPGALAHMASLAAGLTLIMALAAATRSMTAVIVTLAGGFAAGLLLVNGLQFQLPGGRLHLLPLGAPPAYASNGLIYATIWISGALLLAAIYLLYHRRQVGRAWVVIGVATLGVVALSLGAGRAFTFNWPAILAEPAATGDIRVDVAGPPVVRVVTQSQQHYALIGGRPVLQATTQTAPSFGTLSIPLKITAPAGITLEVDRRRVDRRLQGGATRTSISGRGGVLGWDLAIGSPVKVPAAAQQIRAKYRLYVRQTLPALTVSSNGPVSLPGGGSCRFVYPEQNAPVGPQLRCVSSTPLCLDIKPLGYDGPGLIGSGCGGDRAMSGFYEYSDGRMNPPAAYPITITRHLVLGLIDRSLSTGWFTPSVEPFQKTPPSPAAAKAPPARNHPA